MEDANEFVDQYRPLLLSYLDARNGEYPEQSGALEFVEEVLNCWFKFARGRVLEEPSPQERTFWFALYQFEELVEYPAMDRLDPYEGILMQNLAEVRELLRVGGMLPEGLFATRPGEDPGAL
jgi:hypothetical protein